MAGGQAREAAAGGSAAAPPSSALDDETYPRWCLTAMMVVTFIAFFSHAAPTDWLRGTRPAAHIVAAQDSSVSTELFAAPSALPHAAVLSEVRGRSGAAAHHASPQGRASLTPRLFTPPPPFLPLFSPPLLHHNAGL
jgi:hypothetical protein